MKKILAGIKRHCIAILFFLTVGGYGIYVLAGFLHARALLPTASRFADYLYLSFNSGDYTSMYKSSAFEGCKCSVDMEKFRGLMDRVMAKLGPARRWVRSEYKVEAAGDTERITLRFRVEHEKGESFDRVIIVKKGDEWLLTDYNVFSTALME